VTIDQGVSPGRLALRAATQLWALAFVAFFGTYISVWMVGLRIPIQLMYAIPLLAWAALRLRGPRDTLDVVVGIGLITLAVVAAAGVDPLGSLGTLGLALAYALLFWLMREVALQPDVQRRLALPVVIGLALWLLAAAIAWIGEKQAWIQVGGGTPPLESSQVFVWGTTNAYPILLLLSVPFLAHLGGGLRRVAAAVVGLAAVIVIPFSQGRAGWLGIAVAIVALDALSGWPVVRGVSVGRDARWRPLLLLAVIGLAGTVALVAGGRMVAVVASNLDARWRVWEQAAGIFMADPLTGSGPGTYSLVRLEHVPDYVERIGVVLAHNVAVQTVADGGLVLAIGFGLVVATWATVTWQRRRQMTTHQRLAAVVVVGMAGASLLDDFSSLTAISALVVTLAAWSVPAPPASLAVSPRRRWALPVLAFAIALVAAWPIVAVESSRLAADRARVAALESRWADAVQAFEEAVGVYATNPANHLGLGLSRAELGDVEGARDAYQEARRLSPGDPRSPGALASLSQSADERIALLDGASRRSNEPQYTYRLALELERGGRAAEAAAAYALAVALQPGLYAQLAAGGDGLTRMAVREELMAAVETIGLREGLRVPFWDVGLADGDLPADAPPAWQAVADAVAGNLDAARAELASARAASPYDRRTHLAAAAVAALACDQADFDAAMHLAGDPRPPRDGLVLGRDPAYRELGLGDYQPSGTDRPPVAAIWPRDLVDIPDCG
jgi:Flp pilus assembly protein TadD